MKILSRLWRWYLGQDVGMVPLFLVVAVVMFTVITVYLLINQERPEARSTTDRFRPVGTQYVPDHGTFHIYQDMGSEGHPCTAVVSSYRSTTSFRVDCPTSK